MIVVCLWAGFGLLAASMAVAFLGVERLRLGPDGLNYERSVVITLGQRRIPLQEIKGFRGEITRIEHDTPQDMYSSSKRPTSPFPSPAAFRKTSNAGSWRW